jgi:chromosomal replication initiation ATPase DnaA
MADNRQLILDWPHRQALGRDDYLVTSCNQEAVDWIDLWPDWPAPVLLICGPSGCGKSHLAAVWQARTGAETINPSHLPDLAALEAAPCPHLLLENAAEIADDTAFFHLYNRIAELGGSILLTAQSPVREWKISLPDLVSRLRAAPKVDIGMPDDPLLGALLVKLFSDRQLAVEPDVITYLIARIERTFESVRSVVARLDDAALAQKRTITVPLAREVLQGK